MTYLTLVARLASAFFKWLTLSVVAICVGCALAFAIYDYREFQPQRAEIAAMLAASHPLERSPPPLLSRLQRAELGDNVSRRAARLILTAIDSVGQRRTLERKSRELLWTYLVRLHLSDADQFLIVRSRTFLGERAFGFQAGAQSVFGRPLDRLTEAELAKLVVIARLPSRYRLPERAENLDGAAHALLARAKSAWVR